MKQQIRQNCINALKNAHTDIHQALGAAKKDDIRGCKEKARLALIAIANTLTIIE